MSIGVKILLGLGAFIILATGGIWLFWERLPIRLVWPYLIQSEIPITSEVQKLTLNGSESGEQTFFIYLPEGYETGEQRYRTLYHLHGAGAQESWIGYDCSGMAAAMEKAVDEGIIDPMIIVCPVDPTKFSMWADSFDGKTMMSSFVIKDLMTHIDSTYRTIAEKNGRALQGFSMGGYGAALNGFKHHELFNAIIIWDGALHDWNTLTTNRASIFTAMFQSEEYFTEWSPFEWATRSADAEIDLFMVVGTMEATRDFASRYKPHLKSTGRQFTYYDSTCPHNLFCMTEELGTEAFTFLAKSFTNTRD